MTVQIGASQIQMDLSQVPTADARALGFTFCQAVKAFYSDPKNVKAFEDWKAKKERNE